jgi:REP-associated tyrosine transposase
VGAASGREARSRDLRKGRISETNRIYLLTSNTHERQKLFLSWCDAAPLIQALRYSQTSGVASTIAYVVMPDHFHWLVALHGKASLSGLMRSIKTWSARAINKTRQAQGLPPLAAIWQSGFHDHAMRAEEDIRQLARYVVTNPLRTGLCRTLRAYPLWDAIWLEDSRPEAAPTDHRPAVGAASGREPGLAP